MAGDKSTLDQVIAEYLSRPRPPNALSNKGYITRIKTLCRTANGQQLYRIVCRQLVLLDSNFQDTLQLLYEACKEVEDSNQPAKIQIFKGFKKFWNGKLECHTKEERRVVNHTALNKHQHVDHSFLLQYLRYFYDQQYVKDNLKQLLELVKVLLGSRLATLFKRGLKMVTALKLEQHLNGLEVEEIVKNRRSIPFFQYKFYFDNNAQNINNVLRKSSSSEEHQKLGLQLSRTYKESPGLTVDDSDLILAMSKKGLHYFYRKLPYQLVETRYSCDQDYLVDFARFLIKSGRLPEAVGIIQRHKLQNKFNWGKFQHEKPAPNLLITNDAFGPTQSAVFGEDKSFLSLLEFGIKETDVSSVSSVEQLRLHKDILEAQMVSFDCETSGGLHPLQPVTLETIQLSTISKVLVIDVPKLKRQPQFIGFIDRIFYKENNQKLLGLNVKSDKVHFNSFMKSGKPFKAFIDLERENLSLSKLTVKHFGREMSKYQQLSGWNTRPLRRAQLHYSALDAHLLLRLLAKMR